MVGRLRGWDYRSPGAYFVTACTHGRRATFGHLVGHTVVLSPIGHAVDDALHTLGRRHPGTRIGAFVVMPDHMHALIDVGLGDVPTVTLSFLVREVKARVTLAARATGSARPCQPIWQRGFHDRIVRSQEERETLMEYIATNPLRWALRHQEETRAST